MSACESIAEDRVEWVVTEAISEHDDAMRPREVVTQSRIRVDEWTLKHGD